METDYKKIFAENLNNQLKRHQKTQTDLVNDLHFNKSSVSTWVQGLKFPRMNKIEQLANYFNIEKSDLLDPQNQPTYEIPTLSLAIQEDQNKGTLQEVLTLLHDLNNKELKETIEFMKFLRHQRETKQDI